jgi:hypothetical protein
MQLLMPVTTSLRAARHVVKVVDALDSEGDMRARFNESQIAARIGNFGKIDYFAVAKHRKLYFLPLTCHAS